MTVTETDVRTTSLRDAPAATSIDPTLIRSRPLHAAPSQRDHRQLRRLSLALVLAVIAVVHGWNLGGWPIFNSDDEGTYYAQAWSALREGELAHYTYWYDHPPLGWLQLSLFLEPLHWFTQRVPAVIGGRMVMVIYTVITGALLYKLARNLGQRHSLALATVPLWALSPLVVFEGRQVFLDNLQLPWVVASLVLATDRRHRLPLHVASGVCFAVAVLTKETALIAAPALLLALWQSAYRPTRAFSMTGWLSCTALVGLAYPLYALLKSELLPGPDHVSLTGALSWQLFERPGTGSPLQAGTDGNTTLVDWLTLDPILMIAGLVAAVLALSVRRLRPIAVLVLLFTASMLRPSGYLPQMLIIIVLPFAALLLTGLAESLWRRAESVPRALGRAGSVLTALVLVAAALAVGNAWTPKLQTAVSYDGNAPYRAALAYLEANVPRDTVVLTDDIAWNDLIRAGWASDGFSGALWYYKLDRDVESRQALPNGWRDVDYVLVGRPMAVLLGSGLTAETDPQVMAAYDNSRTIASWGEGGSRVELRKVMPPIGPGL